MRNKLFVFGRLAHDAKGILAAIHRLTLVTIKLRLKVALWIGIVGLELGITPFADTDDRGRRYFYDPQLALWHDCSLAHRAGVA